MYSWMLSNYTSQEHYIPGGISICFHLITIMLSTSIVTIIWRTKPRLHTVNHLMICNACIGSSLHSAALTNSLIYVIFISWDTSDMSCRVRGYFTYAGIAGVLYSYMLQSISRFGFSVLSTKHRWVTKFKTHYIMICIQWLIVFSMLLSVLITTDVQYYSGSLCWIPKEAIRHRVYSMIVIYGVPVTIAVLMYASIYGRLMLTKRNATTNTNSLHGQKRDLQVLRNIIILISIFVVGGFPIILSTLVFSKISYLSGLCTESIAIACAKIFIILSDRELRQVVKAKLYRQRSVMPVIIVRSTEKNQQAHEKK